MMKCRVGVRMMNWGLMSSCYIYIYIFTVCFYVCIRRKAHTISHNLYIPLLSSVVFGYQSSFHNTLLLFNHIPHLTRRVHKMLRALMGIVLSHLRFGVQSDCAEDRRSFYELCIALPIFAYLCDILRCFATVQKAPGQGKLLQT